MVATRAPSRTALAAHRERLRAVSRAYLHQAGALSYDELRQTQSPPWGSVAFGAAGIALALTRAPARVRTDPRAVTRWLASAARSAGQVGSFTRVGGSSESEVDHGSLHYGPAGLELVALLVGGGGAKGRRARVSSFLRRCEEARPAPTELLQGAAGFLTGLVILHRATPEPRVLAAAGALAGDLLARARGAEGWMRGPVLGLAHGRAGTFHALLGWARASKQELPAWFWDGLAELAKDVDQGGSMGAPPDAQPFFQRSWCNGASGLALLWTRAYELTRDPAHLARARSIARFLVAPAEDPLGDLCCGSGGRAYALLAMDRVEPRRGWHERAVAFAGDAAMTLVGSGSAWPNGLYKGFPGLVCLARDVLRAPATRSGFPLVEG